MKPHSVSAFSAFEAVTSERSMAKVIGLSALGGAPAWMCQTGFDSRSPGALALVGFEELLVLVDVARDDVEIEPLGRLRLAIHEQRQAFRAGVAQPFLDGQPVAFRLGDFLAVLVEEQLVVKAFRRQAAERAADFARQLDRVDQILAGHFVVDAERDPAHGPIGLPLQLAAPAGDGRGDALAAVGVLDK